MARFREFLRDNSDSPDDEELLAAKFMGRWRSGAPPLVLAPDRDDPELGADPPLRNNDFNYKDMDPFGYAARSAPMPGGSTPPGIPPTT